MLFIKPNLNRQFFLNMKIYIVQIYLRICNINCENQAENKCVKMSCDSSVWMVILLIGYSFNQPNQFITVYQLIFNKPVSILASILISELTVYCNCCSNRFYCNYYYQLNRSHIWIVTKHWEQKMNSAYDIHSNNELNVKEWNDFSLRNIWINQTFHCRARLLSWLMKSHWMYIFFRWNKLVNVILHLRYHCNELKDFQNRNRANFFK